MAQIVFNQRNLLELQPPRSGDQSGNCFAFGPEHGGEPFKLSEKVVPISSLFVDSLRSIKNDEFPRKGTHVIDFHCRYC